MLVIFRVFLLPYLFIAIFTFEAQAQEISNNKKEGTEKIIKSQKSGPGIAKVKEKKDADLNKVTPPINTMLSAEVNPIIPVNSPIQTESSWWAKLWTDPVATFTGLLAVVTIGLIITGVVQWQESRNTAKKQLRAYLGVEDITLDCPNINNTAYKPLQMGPGLIATDYIIVRIKNFGLTPAKDVSVWLNWMSMPFLTLLPENFSYADVQSSNNSGYGPIISRRILNSNQVHSTMVAALDIRPFMAALKKITTIYFYGHINYRDIYNALWQHDFCFVYEPFVKQPFHLTYYKEHNEEKQLFSSTSA